MLIFRALSFTTIPHLLELLLVRYSNACLRRFVVVLQDLHCLQRSYHVDHWCITLYHHATFPHLVELLLVRYNNPCLRLLLLYYKIYIIYRDFITTLIIKVLNYTIIQMSHLAGLSLVRYRIVWPPLILHGLRLFLVILQEVHRLKIFNMTMHYPQWNYITVPRFIFICVTQRRLDTCNT